MRKVIFVFITCMLAISSFNFPVLHASEQEKSYHPTDPSIDCGQKNNIIIVWDCGVHYGGRL